MSSRLQRLIEWPLWSWRHLSVSVAALLVVLALVGKASSVLAPRTPPSGAVATPVAPGPSASLAGTPTTTPMPAATTSGTHAPASTGTATSHPCQAAAAAFINAWVRTALPPGEWLSGMRPYASPEFMVQLSRADPTRVPASRVTGQPVAVQTAADTTVFRFATDGGRVDVSTKRSGASCLVNDIEPSNDVPGAPKPALTPLPADG
ncbi:hypothetical protein GCM10009858_43710 [Terrabacter carboxydivorans]|uniref:Uncharacterized protein n=1 Tax=Terrabacter carboxydivorans TaxID=619730 RepID=A0ABP5ZLT1_9MICO